MNPGNKGRRKNRNFTVRKLSEMRRIAGINEKKYILKKRKKNPQFAHSTLGKIYHRVLVIYRETCESSSATALKLHTAKQNPALNAFGAAFLSFENSYTNFAGFLYVENKEPSPYEILLQPPCVSAWLSDPGERPPRCFHFTSLQAATHCEGKTITPHRGTENLELICTLKPGVMLGIMIPCCSVLANTIMSCFQNNI